MAAVFSVKNVFKGACIYGSGEALVKGIGLVLLPVYTRYLSPEEYGIIGYLAVFLQIGAVLVAFGAHGAQTRYYYENGADAAMMGRFAFTINVVPISVALVIGLPLALIGTAQGWTLGAAQIPFMPYMVFTMWAIVMQVIANNAASWYRARQQFSVAALLQVFRFGSIAAFSLILIIGFNLEALGYIAGLAVGISVFVAATVADYAKHFVWRPSKEAVIYALGFGAPIVVHLLAGKIHTAIDRVILERYVSLDDLGIYTVAFMIGNAFNVLLVAFNQAYQPFYFQLMSSGRSDKNSNVAKVFRAWLVLVTVVSLAAMALGGPFLSFFAGQRFHAAIDLFPWIILAMYLGGYYYFFASPIFYLKKTKYLPLITGISAIINIALNLLWIPLWGVTGAAAATVISHGALSLLAFLVGGRLCSVKWPISSILLSCLAVVAVFCLVVL